MKVVAYMTDELSISWRLMFDDRRGAELQRRPPGMSWEFALRFPVHSEAWPTGVDYRAKLAELVARAKERNREARKSANRAKRSRKARRQVERWQERVHIEKPPVATREPTQAPRINGALSTGGDALNASLQTEDAWRRVWSDALTRKELP